VTYAPVLLGRLPPLSHYSPARAFLPSFPTRRSSDLAVDDDLPRCGPAAHDPGLQPGGRRAARRPRPTHRTVGEGQRKEGLTRHRSEEHTSELQSRVDLVCRLLLEEKKETPGRAEPTT